MRDGSSRMSRPHGRSSGLRFLLVMMTVPVVVVRGVIVPSPVVVMMVMIVPVVVMPIIMMVMVVPMPVIMVVLMVMQPLARTRTARVLAEDERLDRHRHRVGRHADAAEVDVVEVP